MQLGELPQQLLAIRPTDRVPPNAGLAVHEREHRQGVFLAEARSVVPPPSMGVGATTKLRFSCP